MSRTKMRELAFTLLYQNEIQKEYDEQNLELFLTNNEIEDEDTKEYIRDIANGVKKHDEEIIKSIEENLKKEWSLSRITKIDFALLKLAIYEIKYKDLPYRIAINEVVELAKKYGDENSHYFINGILASIVKESI